MTELRVTVDDDILEAMERRAAENGRSIEDEHREILVAALRSHHRPKRTFTEILVSMPPHPGDNDPFDVR